MELNQIETQLLSNLSDLMEERKKDSPAARDLTRLTFAELNLDSLEQVELAMQAESSFGVEFLSHELEKVETIAQMSQLVRLKMDSPS